MARLHVSALPIICWALMISLATTIHALNTTAHFKLFHAIASNATVSPLSPSIDAILASTSDLVVITTPFTTATDNTTTNAQALLKIYSLIGANRILYKSAEWSVVREATMNGTVWTRLKSSTLAFVCIVVDTTNDSDSIVYNTVERIDSFCGPQDTVVLGFTTAVSDALSLYLQAQTTQQDKLVPRVMAETCALVRQRLGEGTATTAAVLTTAQKRLYVHAADVACLEAASTEATQDSVGVMMAFCVGSECTPCQQQGVPFERSNQTTLAPSQPGRTSGGKQGLVVLVSCGTFLLGCGLVFYILFHKQFFLPDGNGKLEKEVATNLAYVLRV